LIVPVENEVEAKLITARFVLIVASGLAYFFALAMLTPVLPLYIKGPLRGSGVAVGIGVGAFAVGAVLLRPYAGRIGDRAGRRWLVIGGALVVSVSIAGYGLVDSLAWLVFARFVTGLGEAAFFVGAATMITDLAPVERRGEAVSYWSIAVYGGLAFGPALGELVLGSHRYVLTWLVSSALALVAAIVGCTLAETDPKRLPGADRADVHDRPKQPLIHPAAVRPGIVLMLGLIGLAGFSAFVSLYARNELHLSGAGIVFLIYGVTILLVRVFGARAPDRLGPIRAGTYALVLCASGMAVIALVPSVAGLIVGTVVFAGGMSLLYPALLVMALADVPDTERGSVVGTFSSFFDLSQGLGALLCGTAQQLFGYRAAFAIGAVLAAAGCVALRAGASRRRAAPAVAEPTPA
jgi:MFS family permease